MGCLAIKRKHVREVTVNLPACTADPVSHTKGNLFGVRTFTTPLVLSSCWPLFTVTSRLHVMNSFGSALGPKRGLSFIGDKDRLLINGPQPLALCLNFRYATNTTGRMLRLREEWQRGTGRLVLQLDRSAGGSRKLILFHAAHLFLLCKSTIEMGKDEQHDKGVKRVANHNNGV